MANIQDLLAQKAALEKQIEEARRQSRSDAIAQIRALMAEHGLTAADLNAKATSRPATKAGKVPAKYRDDRSGATWSGRGLQPKWLKAALAEGRKLEEFAVAR